MPSSAVAGTSGCGLCGVEAVEQALPDLKVLPGAPLPPAQWLDGLRQRISEFQPLGQHCGAVHAAVYMDAKGELLMGREDIGRHCRDLVEHLGNYPGTG